MFKRNIFKRNSDLFVHFLEISLEFNPDIVLKQLDVSAACVVSIFRHELVISSISTNLVEFFTLRSGALICYSIFIYSTWGIFF